jgi:predicted deacylase
MIVLYQFKQVLDKRNYDYVKSGPGLIEIKMLSDYFKDLKNTSVDTRVFVLKGSKEGGKALILGGTHGNEISGILSAMYFIENAYLEKGTVFIIPRANESAASSSSKLSGDEDYLILSENRKIRIGSRRTNIIDQWPEKGKYFLRKNLYLKGNESRNLNRVYPGKRDGNLTEKLAFGISELVRKEHVDLTFDLHEGRPEFNALNTAVVSKNAIDLSLETVLDLELEGLSMKIDESGKNLHGLIHNELPKVTDTKVILMETVNTAQGSNKGEVTNEIYLSGEDAVYKELKKMGKTSPVYRPYTLSERIARHVTCVDFFLRSLKNLNGEKEIILKGIPAFKEMKNKDIEKLF